MTFKVQHKVVTLLLVALLLLALAVPMLGAATGQAGTEPHNAALFESNEAGTGPATAIACNCPDPGGSGGCC
ncbi:MAG: hypothetical protein L0332_16140 [Chloroflexi bacterium]|nr:hypothetical protein [Chloroflexota bacterium]MCI0577698.1 hypothetical protein [Chloroflexota bacterium]MCI0645732.1 hypothetical protein [Chloroflexota bacterium]MCI0728232.1 hypothetical protein [Chloroflexota bacterium]